MFFYNQRPFFARNWFFLQKNKFVCRISSWLLGGSERVARFSVPANYVPAVLLHTQVSTAFLRSCQFRDVTGVGKRSDCVGVYRNFKLACADLDRLFFYEKIHTSLVRLDFSSRYIHNYFPTMYKSMSQTIRHTCVKYYRNCSFGSCPFFLSSFFFFIYTA